jgi:hypothetical protein
VLFVESKYLQMLAHDAPIGFLVEDIMRKLNLLNPMQVAALRDAFRDGNFSLEHESEAPHGEFTYEPYQLFAAKDIYAGHAPRSCNNAFSRQQTDDLILPSHCSPPLPMKLLSLGRSDIPCHRHSNSEHKEYALDRGFGSDPAVSKEDWNLYQRSALVAEMGLFPHASLREHLANLRSMDTQSILVVRKIHRLGMNSAQCLHSHFSRYGEVIHILVPSPKTKASKRASQASAGRLFPAPIGFVVMRNVEDVKAVLADGAAPMVDPGTGAKCIPIEIRLFEHRNFVLKADDDDADDANLQSQEDWIVLTL